MLGPKTVASIDVGTTKVCTVLARLDWTEKLEILGVSSIPSQGLWKGEVVNVEEAAKSIMLSVAEVYLSCGVPVTSAYIGITGSHVTCLNNYNLVGKSRNFRFFSSGMVNRVLEQARDDSVRANTEVLHVIPRAYHLDGRRRIGNPSGVRGNLLEMETHVIVGAIQRINLLVRSVQDAGIKVKGLVLEPLASSEAVLSRQERELGVVLADIGGGSTDVAAFTDGSIWYTSVIPVGGNHITSDLATGLDVDFQQAEEIKLMYGHALPEEVDPLEMVSLNSASQQRRSTVSRQEICQIIRARVEETLELIFDMIEKAELEAGPAAGIVLTGGTAKLPGIETLAQQILKMPVRVGRPNLIDGAPASVQDPAFATSMGIIIWKLIYEDGESKLDHLGYTNYFNQFSKRMLSRVAGPSPISSGRWEPEVQP